MVSDLPTPGAPVMPTRMALPVVGQQLLHELVRLVLVVGALALDQRDGARQHGAVAVADAAGEGDESGVAAIAVMHAKRAERLRPRPICAAALPIGPTPGTGLGTADLAH